MTIQRKHGCWGEDLASGFLSANGIELVERNWRYRRAEIDFIGMDKDILVFIEVKMRASLAFGRPEDMVGPRKRRLIIDAAMAYMRQSGYEREIRFDVVAIYGQPGVVPEIRHFRDAFFPGLDYPG